MTLVVLLDYGSGNLHSAKRALARVGADVTVTSDFDEALNAEALVVPGVGAFAACMEGLTAVRGERIIGRRLAGGRPVLGICVGMQILFDRGVEFGVEADGCGEWPGTVERLQADVLPHMGWNTVEAPENSVLFDGIDRETRFYFVHSYALAAQDPQEVLAVTDHGGPVTAMVGRDNIAGTQFHPEKSQKLGLKLITNFLGWTP